jgi:uncharacterized protein (DUF1501 family)
MKRRQFVKNVSIAGAAAPFVVNDMKMQAVTKKLFGYSKMAEDRVLVIIRLNGGNDGLNTVIPRDQYANLVIQRSNILMPEPQILPLTAEVGLHHEMGGMKNMYDDGKLAIIQNVGYPQQNRSHFRSMDIWTTGALNPQITTGWLGRAMDNDYPNYPSAYPNTTYPDPFAISMGYDVSATCQGLMGNFSHAVEDPFVSFSLQTSAALNDGTYYGSHMEYITTLIGQSNAYGNRVNQAANAGTTLSTMYDPTNALAVQLRYVAQMISGGLDTKVYILNIDGFDTHDQQVSPTNPLIGAHATLMKRVSDAIAAFQDDCDLIGISNRVAGMTFSEFGRQVAANASYGTDHGDAAPMFLFGSCISAGIMGNNPTISNTISNQAGVDLQYDFRDIYASILNQWFEVDKTEIQTMFEQTITYYDVLGACNLGLGEESEEEKAKALLFPNPAYDKTTIRFNALNEWVKIEVFDMLGAKVALSFDGNLKEGQHNIPMDLHELAVGQYTVQITKESGSSQVKLSKVK